MIVRWLGWAGVEIESEGESVVVDPLEDAGATYRPFGVEGELPELAGVARSGAAVAGLVTHLHRDHADAEALGGALAPGAPVLGPPAGEGPADEYLACAQADAELAAAGLPRERLGPWESRSAGPFELTALPALDGLGDPQVSWLIAAADKRVLHLGDTSFHSDFWRIARRYGPFDLVLAPINGAVIDFPHLQPASTQPAVLSPEQAVLAARLIGAKAVTPIHYGGYRLAGRYEPVPDARECFLAEAASAGVEARPLAPGEAIEL